MNIERILAEFRLNGFVILRNFIPEDEVEAMHEELFPYLMSRYTMMKQSNFEEGRGKERVALRLEEFVRQRGKALNGEFFPRNVAIDELVGLIFGPHEWSPRWTLVEACFPGSVHMGWHADQKPEDTPDPYGPHETVRVTYNVPLVDFVWSNGAMEMLPGSHMQPRMFSVETDIGSIKSLFPVRLELARGDVLIRDGNCLHRGTPNLGSESRPMLDQTFVRGDYGD